MHTNLTSKLQLTDSLLTDQLTKRSRNRPLKQTRYHTYWTMLLRSFKSELTPDKNQNKSTLTRGTSTISSNSIKTKKLSEFRLTLPH